MALRICVTSGIPSMYSVAVGPVTGGPARRAEAKADLFSSRDVGKSYHCRERGGGARGQELRKENGLNHYLVKPAGRATLARVGPTTPTRAGRLAGDSVDPTEARYATVGSEYRLDFFPADSSMP